MAHHIELPENTFAKLQKLAVPLVDTTISVIDRLIEFYETRKHHDDEHEGSSDPAPTTDEFDPALPPDLTHTKVIGMGFGNLMRRSRTSWNGLLIAAVKHAQNKLKDPQRVRQLVIVNSVEGRKEDEGFAYLPEIDLSIQGQDANSAWKAAYHIARQADFPIRADFVWRHKPGALYPGKAASLYSR